MAVTKELHDLSCSVIKIHKNSYEGSLLSDYNHVSGPECQACM
jgi:hypothetical protein